jgi:hypothetical protein
MVLIPAAAAVTAWLRKKERCAHCGRFLVAPAQRGKSSSKTPARHICPTPPRRQRIQK